MLTCYFQDYYFPISFVTWVTVFWKDIGINTLCRLCFSFPKSQAVSKSGDGGNKMKRILISPSRSLAKKLTKSKSSPWRIDAAGRGGQARRRRGRLCRGGDLTHWEENMSSCVHQAPSCITAAVLNLTAHIEILILPLAALTTEARISTSA